MLTIRQINVARQYGRLYQLHEGNIYGRKIEDLYYEWAGQNVPHNDHEDLHAYFRSPASPAATPPPDQVKVRDLAPGDRIKRGTDAVTIGSIHHVRDSNGERWRAYDDTGSALLVSSDGDLKYSRHVEPPTRTIEVTDLQPGDELAEFRTPQIVTKVIRQEIATTANQKTIVRYSVYLNGNSRPAFDDLLPNFVFTIKTNILTVSTITQPNREGQIPVYVNANQTRIAQLLGEAARRLDIEDPTVGGRGARNLFNTWITHHAKFSDAQRAELTGEFAGTECKVPTPTYRTVRTDQLCPNMVLEDGRRVSSIIRSVHTTTNAWGKSDKITYDIFFAPGHAEENVSQTRQWSVQY